MTETTEATARAASEGGHKGRPYKAVGLRAATQGRPYKWPTALTYGR